MPNDALSNITDILTTEFNSVPDSLLEIAVNRALREFFRSTYLLDDVAEIKLEGRGEYLIPAKDGQDLFRVWQVQVGEGTNLATLDNIRDWELDLNGNRPILVLHTETAGCPEALVRYNYIPSNRSCEIPQYLLRQYEDAIIIGAKSYLFDFGSLPGFNPQIANNYELKFRNAIRNASVDKATNFGRGVKLLVSGWRFW